jgi:hypothetical protein
MKVLRSENLRHSSYKTQGPESVGRAKSHLDRTRSSGRLGAARDVANQLTALWRSRTSVLQRLSGAESKAGLLETCGLLLFLRGSFARVRAANYATHTCCNKIRPGPADTTQACLKHSILRPPSEKHSTALRKLTRGCLA